MNLSDLPRVVTAGHHASTTVDRIGKQLFKATATWQSPLRSTGAKGPKNEVADPTGNAAAKPDPLALEHDALVADLRAFWKAATNLSARLQRLEPIDPTKVERGRASSVPACLACTGPAVRCRRGLCDPCYTAWLREDRPDMLTFTRSRQAVPEREHVDPTSVPSGNNR